MYRWAEHTAEVELRLEAASEEELFAEALAAIGELLAGEGVEGRDRGGEEGTESVELDASAPDRPALLAAWIEELLYLAESRSLIPVAADSVAVDEGQDGSPAVWARLRARRGTPRPLVKAVTYHRLELEPGPEGWRGRAVLDV